MTGVTSTTKNLAVALEFSKCSAEFCDLSGNSVIFVFLFQNFNNFRGYRLNKPEYSAYPQEEECIFIEGIKLKVIKVEESVQIQN